MKTLDFTFTNNDSYREYTYNISCIENKNIIDLDSVKFVIDNIGLRYFQVRKQFPKGYDFGYVHDEIFNEIISFIETLDLKEYFVYVVDKHSSEWILKIYAKDVCDYEQVKSYFVKMKLKKGL